MPINITGQLTARTAKNDADAAVEAATAAATLAYLVATLATVEAAAQTGVYQTTVALPGGLNNQDILMALINLGFAAQFQTNNTQILIDWSNPNDHQQLPSTKATF